MIFMYKVFLLIILNISISNTNAKYQSLKLETYEICQKKSFKKFYDASRKILTGRDPEITLGTSKNSAAIIHQVWNSTTMKRFSMNCKFVVRTYDENTKIYTVVTKLKLRHNDDGTCLDWLELSGGKRGASSKICEDIGIDGTPAKLIFDDRVGEVKIHVNVRGEYYLDDANQLELKLVLTTHTVCNEDYNFLCDSNDPTSCISKEYVGDNIPNCMNNCTDEDSCFPNENVVASEIVDYSHIAISAITSLIFTMFGVGAIIYICWKYWHMFGRPRDETADIPTIEFAQSDFNGIIITEEQHQQPSAPKDLPPSYESLFPES